MNSFHLNRTVLSVLGQCEGLRPSRTIRSRQHTFLLESKELAASITTFLYLVNHIFFALCLQGTSRHSNQLRQIETIFKSVNST